MRTVDPEIGGLQAADATVSVKELELPLETLVAQVVEATVTRMGWEKPDAVVSELGSRWHKGKLVIHPADPTLQTKEVPLETFFHKIVGMRNQMRVLEQKINGHPQLNDGEKAEMQQYITRCYGAMTTFNVLFAAKGVRIPRKLQPIGVPQPGNPEPSLSRVTGRVRRVADARSDFVPTLLGLVEFLQTGDRQNGCRSTPADLQEELKGLLASGNGFGRLPGAEGEYEEVRPNKQGQRTAVQQSPWPAKDNPIPRRARPPPNPQRLRGLATASQRPSGRRTTIANSGTPDTLPTIPNAGTRPNPPRSPVQD